MGPTVSEVTGPVLGCHTTLSRERSEAWLGDQSILGCVFLLDDCKGRCGGIPHRFEVLVPERELCNSEDLSLLQLVIDVEKPAHTSFTIRTVAPAGSRH